MLCSLLSGCGGFSPPAEIRPEVPVSLLAPCPDVTEPAGDMTAADIWRAWNSDRWAAAVCRSRHAGLVSALAG